MRFAHQGHRGARVWLLTGLIGGGLITGCANPELTYVELPALSGEADAGASDTGQDNAIESRTSATSAAIGSMPSEVTETPAATDSIRDASSEHVDATSDESSVDARVPPSRVQDADVPTPDSATSSGAVSVGPPARDAASDAERDSDVADTAPDIVCDCPNEVNPCLVALCLGGLTICTFTPQPGTECDDGDPCTVEDTCNDSGECGGEPKDCSGEDGLCLEGVCNDESGACEAKPSVEETPCDDDDPCSLNDVCDGEGECGGQPRDCSELNSSCTEGVCERDTGECLAQPINEGQECDDEDNCTQADVCSDEGVCGGEVVDCSEVGGACSVGVCDPEDGQCKPEPLSGLACDDGDACTVLDACDEGECRGQAADDCGDAGWLDLSTGQASVTMSNECADDDFDVRSDVPEDSDCDRSSGNDVVFMLDLSGFDTAVTVRASTSYEETTYDTVLFLMQQECADDALVVCVDDSEDEGYASSFQTTVEPGVYALVVDSYRGNEEGTFRLDVALE